MARMGYKEGANGILNLLIVPITGLETEAVFTLLHADKYPLQIKGEIIFTEDSSPQIILYGNNVVRKTKGKGETKMKLEIYHEEKETVVQEPIRLRLVKNDAGSVILTAVDKDGGWINDLVVINADGTLYREQSVDETLGFKLDKNDRIRETK